MEKTKRIVFATNREFSTGTDDERLVQQQLGPMGIESAFGVWDDPGIDWSVYDAVIVRCTWDYHLKAADYAAWLRRVAALGLGLWNPADVILGNINKRYLIELAQQGVSVVPTIYHAAGDTRSLREILAECGWAEAVVKPAISAGARGTWRASLTSADDAKFATQLLGEDLLIQPYMAEVAELGELSLMFFAGEYSHAVLKTPKAGDFRVHQHLGGSTVATQPAPEVIAQAKAIVAMQGKLLYARIDCVVREGRLVLMELEINEPYLFLGYEAGAARRFAEAIRGVV